MQSIGFSSSLLGERMYSELRVSKMILALEVFEILLVLYFKMSICSYIRLLTMVLGRHGF